MLLQKVKGRSGNYEIRKDGRTIYCSCPSWKFSKEEPKVCKHIEAYLTLNQPRPKPKPVKLAYVVVDHGVVVSIFSNKGEAENCVRHLNYYRPYYTNKAVLQTKEVQ